MTKQRETINSQISDEELLLRAVSYSGLGEKNHPTPLAFRLRPGERELSLCREILEDLFSFLKRAISIKFLSAEDRLAGAIELSAKEVRSLDRNIILEATPNPSNPSHAGISFRMGDGTIYKAKKKNTVPTDASVLGYELALASIVRRVYDKRGSIVWANENVL